MSKPGSKKTTLSGPTPVYPTLSTSLKCKLQVTQNKIVYFIFNLSPRSHIGQAQLDALNYFSVKYRVSELRLNHVFKVVHETQYNYGIISVVYLVDIHVENQVATICIYQMLKA